jgi:hypothetical protein
MPRDLNGAYSLPNGTIVNTGDTIIPGQHNPPFNDVADALSGSLSRDGLGGMRADLSLGNFKITGLGNATAANDAVAFGQLNGLVGTAFTSPNFLTAGAVVLRDALGNPGSVYLQATTNDGVTQYAFIRFSSGTMAFSGNICPELDAVFGCGLPSNRWNTVYAVTGAINTSDERDKTWRGAMNAAEHRAAKRIFDELGFYQWNDSIAEKGSAARFHFGPRAQRVWAVMAGEGLIDPIENGGPNSSKYAFLCYDEGEEIPDGRFGIRPDELSMFLGASIHARLAALEAI